MPPSPTIGSLPFQVTPPSSLMAMIPNEYPSEYIGTSRRPDGSSSGWVRVNQPIREKYSSSACSTSLAPAVASCGLSPAAVATKALVFAAMFFGTRTMLS